MRSFYVYRLIDPRNGLPFYVGKGQNDRAWQHEKVFRAGKAVGCTRKNAKIAEIVATGSSVGIEIVAEYDDELDALDHEFRLVDSDPTLTNIQPGGSYGGKESPLRAKRRKELYEKKRRLLIEARARKSVDEFHRKFDRRAERFLEQKGAERYRDEIEAWISSVRDERIPIDKPKPNPKKQAAPNGIKKKNRRFRRKVTNSDMKTVFAEIAQLPSRVMLP